MTTTATTLTLAIDGPTVINRGPVLASKLVSADEYVVLVALLGDGAVREYATWIVTVAKSGAPYAFWGHYHRNLSDAIADFNVRA